MGCGGAEDPAKENRIVPLFTNFVVEMLLYLYALRSSIKYYINKKEKIFEGLVNADTPLALEVPESKF